MTPAAVSTLCCGLSQIFTLLGFHEFLPSSEVVSKLEGQLCQVQPYLCANLLSAICGYNPNNIDIERLPTYLNYTPSGTSVKNMAHWSQVRALCVCVCVCLCVSACAWLSHHDVIRHAELHCSKFYQYVLPTLCLLHAVAMHILSCCCLSGHTFHRA